MKQALVWALALNTLSLVKVPSTSKEAAHKAEFKLRSMVKGLSG